MTTTAKPEVKTDPPLVPKCPECDTELVLVNNKPPDSCAKCGFTLEGYDVFFRWFNKAMAAYEQGRKITELPPEVPVPPVRKGVLSRLGGKR